MGLNGRIPTLPHINQPHHQFGYRNSLVEDIHTVQGRNLLCLTPSPLSETIYLKP
jgi:hypothetical protein